MVFTHRTEPGLGFKLRSRFCRGPFWFSVSLLTTDSSVLVAALRSGGGAATFPVIKYLAPRWR